MVDANVQTRVDSTSGFYVFLLTFTDLGFSQAIQRIREEANALKPKMSKDPEGVAIDFFDPDYWNHTLNPYERYQITRGKKPVVALPPLQYCVEAEWKQWRELSNEEFMERFGNDILTKYNIPTKEEAAAFEEDSDDEDISDGDVSSNGDIEGDGPQQPVAGPSRTQQPTPGPSRTQPVPGPSSVRRHSLVEDLNQLLNGDDYQQMSS